MRTGSAPHRSSSARMTCPDRCVEEDDRVPVGVSGSGRRSSSSPVDQPPMTIAPSAIAATMPPTAITTSDQVVRLLDRMDHRGRRGCRARRWTDQPTRHRRACGDSRDVIAVDRRPHYVPPSGVHLPSMPDTNGRGVLRTVPDVSDRSARQVRVGRTRRRVGGVRTEDERHPERRRAQGRLTPSAVVGSFA